jgi:undecaprenyl-diphosphatase
MTWQRLRGFIARRLSPEEYLGLHLTVGLLLSLALLFLFAAVARSVEADRHLTQFDRTLGLALQKDRQENPWTRDLFRAITQLGSVPAMTSLALFGALALLANRRWLLALVWVIAPAGGGLLDLGLKTFFERPRPEFRDAAITETTMSFPSGHSMGSLIGYGMLAYLLLPILPRWWARAAIISGFAVLVLAIGFSRIYLGAHYFSDVLGGFAVGGFWLAACLTGIEAARRRGNTPPAKLN